MNTELQRLFRPKSIAVIGGGAWCESVVEQCLKIGFDGPIWPVHPKRANIGGVLAFSSVANLPAGPDAVFIGINRHALVAVLPELNAIGAGGAVCFASGFLETGDTSLQANLLKAAGDMAILGPNCYGFVNYLDRCALWPDQHGGEAVDTGVAIITQSSNIAQNLTMQTRGLPLAYLVTAGNQAQTSLAEIGAALLDDERVSALGCYIEGFGDLAAYEALAKQAQALGKRVVVLKAGRSVESQAASVSHTASLAGDDAGAQAFIERLGFIRVDTLPQLLETLKLAHVAGDMSGSRIASLSCSGGEASLIADAGTALPVSFPPLGDDRTTRLDKVLGELVTLANPLDYHTGIWRNHDAMTEVFSAMSGPDFDITLLIIDFPRADRCEDEDWIVAIEALEQASQNGGLYGVVASMPEGLPEIYAKRLMDKGIVPFCGIDDALLAISGLAAAGVPAELPVLRGNTPETTTMLTEHAAKQALAAFGLTVPHSTGGLNVNEVADAAATIGFPVVLKGEGFAHKSEAGAVLLGLCNADEVREAAQKMDASTYLVEEAISGAVAELLIGVTLDPAHGHILTIAAGGVLTEILQDSQTLLIPTGRAEIGAALTKLKSAKLLTGFRGKPAADQPAIIDAVLAIQKYVIANAGKISEVEVNPLLCTPTRAIAVDALTMKEI